MNQYNQPGGSNENTDLVIRRETDLVSTQPDDQETAVIRVEIEQTRNEMSETINAIQSKLVPEQLIDQAKEAAKEVADHAVHEATEAIETKIKPEQLIEQAKEAVKEVAGHAVHQATEQAKDAVHDATIGKVEHLFDKAQSTVGGTLGHAQDTVGEVAYQTQGRAGQIIDIIKQNPLPAALAGIGVGWLAMNSRNQSSGGTMEDRPYTSENMGREDYASFRDTGARYYNQPGYSTSTTYGQAQPQYSTSTTYGQSQPQYQSTYRSGQSQGLGGGIMNTIKQNPLPAALAALSIGWLFMNNRSSSSSSQMSYGSYQGQSGSIGNTISQAQNKVGDVADQAQYKASNIASDVKETVSDVADQAQYKASNIASDVKETVSDVADQAQYKASNIASDVKETVGDVASQTKQVVGQAASQTRSTSGDVVTLIKQNPIPAALVGLGLGWLYKSSRGGQMGSQMYSPQRMGGGYSSQRMGGGYSYSSQQSGGGIVSETRDRVSDVASSTRDRVSDVASNTVDRASDIASNTRDRVGEATDRAQLKALGTKYRFQEILYENPLPVGALSLALGAVAGLVLPGTQGEQQLMGQTRDNLVDKAKDVAQDTMQKVQNVAEEAKHAGEREAKAQGLADTSS